MPACATPELEPVWWAATRSARPDRGAGARARSPGRRCRRRRSRGRSRRWDRSRNDRVMNVLVTGATGFVGAALIPRLQAAGHEVRAYARRPDAVAGGIEVVQGDAIAGTGLAEALDGIDCAYYLIHSMEPSVDGTFADRDRRAATNFAEAAQAAGVGRVIYLGGLVPDGKEASLHLASRLEVEQVLR